MASDGQLLPGKNLSSLVSSESETDSLPEKTGSFSSFPSPIA